MSYSKEEFIFMCESLAVEPGMPKNYVKALRENIAWAEAGKSEFRIIWIRDLMSNQPVPKWVREMTESELADTKGLL